MKQVQFKQTQMFWQNCQNVTVRFDERHEINDKRQALSEGWDG